MISRTTDWMSLAREIAPVPWILDHVHSALADEVPVLAGHLRHLPQPKLFGLNSGFFYFPVATVLELSGGDRAAAREMAISIAYGHAYFYGLDRLLDDAQVEHPLVLASPLLLSAYLSGLARQVGEHDGARDLVDAWHSHYYKMYVHAQIYEWQVSGQLPPLTNEDLSLLGQKSAPVCLPLRVAMHKYMHTGGLAEKEDAFLTYCAGLQLMDDLSDIGADYQNRLSSVPIRMILREALRLESWPRPEQVDSDDIHIIASRSRTGEAVLGLACKYFEAAAEKAHALEMETLRVLAHGKLERCDQWLLELRAQS